MTRCGLGWHQLSPSPVTQSRLKTGRHRKAGGYSVIARNVCRQWLDNALMRDAFDSQTSDITRRQLPDNSANDARNILSKLTASHWSTHAPFLVAIIASIFVCCIHGSGTASMVKTRSTAVNGLPTAVCTHKHVLPACRRLQVTCSDED